MSKFNSVKKISSIGITDIVGSAISAFFWFYLASLIGPEQYGEINYLISIAAFASNIALFGATQTLLVYSSKNIKIHATLYLLNLVIGSISAIIISFLVEDFSVGLLAIGYLIFAISYSDLLGKKILRKYSFVIIIQKILMVTLTIGFYFIFGAEYIILGMSISFFVGIFSILNGFKNSQINFVLFKEKISFIIFNYFQSILGAFHGSIDKIIIAPLFGFIILGNYSLAIQFFSLLLVIPVVFGKYLIPSESSGIENNRVKIVMIIISVGIGISGVIIGPKITLLLFPKFEEIQSIIPVISLVIIPSTIAMIYTSKLLALEKSNYILIIGIFRTSSMISLLLILGQIFQIQGIALAVLCSEIIGVIVSKICIYKIEKK